MSRTPEQILQAIERKAAGEQRGRLRIFLGMCPGVGKTYSMLKAGKEQSQRNNRVMIGVVETHGRKETEELVTGFDVIPKMPLRYKGTRLFEMDLDKILEEKPSLVLVDELAHTNAPGSRHEKRYQDVEEILDAGIDVYTTLNIQHIESRNDQVAQITGVQVRETVPDAFLVTATQIELIDLSPEELLRRLQEGKVYMGDRAVSAAQNFFREEHLTALRELALRFTAEKVDQDLHDQMIMKGIQGPWNTNERLLVAVSHSPHSSRLIRATRRMAYNLESPWVALHVSTNEALSPEDQETLQKNLALARKLGGEIVNIAGTNLVQAIQKVCAEKNVTQIVMGRPDRRFFRDLFARGTLLDQLVRETSKIDIPRDPGGKETSVSRFLSRLAEADESLVFVLQHRLVFIGGFVFRIRTFADIRISGIRFFFSFGNLGSFNGGLKGTDFFRGGGLCVCLGLLFHPSNIYILHWVLRRLHDGSIFLRDGARERIFNLKDSKTRRNFAQSRSPHAAAV